MASQAWKRHERETARYFGTRRRVRGGDFSMSDADIVVNVDDWVFDGTGKLPKLSIVVECKYGQNLGVVKTFREVTTGLKSKCLMRLGNFLLCDLEDFQDVLLGVYLDQFSIIPLSDEYSIVKHHGHEPKYLSDYNQQAQGYCDTLEGSRTSIPLVCLAKSGTRGRVTAISCDSVSKLHDYEHWRRGLGL